ncbi:MAG: insulinase family protein [Opitutaceae bacterium]|nr:insulinase family protein [Opitutaceae bacterium]
MIAVLGLLAALGSPLPAAQAPILLPVANDPTVSFRLWFKVGAQNDPAGKEGLAALTAAMLTEAATQTHRYDEILDRLFPLASDYGAVPSMEMTVITGRTHLDNLADFYPLLRDAVLAPAFKQEDLDRLRSRTLNFIENQLRFANDEELGKAVLYGEIFAGTPYGHLGAGTVAALKSITLDDVRAFYAAHYTRDNVVIGLGGGIPAMAAVIPDRPAAWRDGGHLDTVTSGNVLPRLKTDLAKLPAGAPPRVPAPAPKPLDGISVTLVEKANASTAISVGFPIEVVRGAREWYALAIANSWLGEHRNQSGRLFQVIREQRGLNYGDYSYIEHYPNGGQRMTPPQNVARRLQLFELWIRPVPHEARHFALRAALREVDLLIKNGLTAEQFEERRAFLKKYVLHYAATTSERLGYAIDDAFYGLSEPHLEKYRRLMDELTLTEVNAAIKKHWSLAHLKIVAVTQDAAAFADALAADAPSPITYATPKPDAVLTIDKEIATFPLKIRRADISIVPVAELFAK